MLGRQGPPGRWNPSSATNTIDGSYRFGVTDTRKRISEWVAEVVAREENAPAEFLKTLAERIRQGEWEP